MKKVIVLGAGMVGRAIAIDLCQDYQVTSVDIDEKQLRHIKKDYPIKKLEIDLNDPKNITDIIQPYDLVIGAVPGFIGFQTLKQTISCGKNIVDISFSERDPFELDSLAKKNGVSAIIDCGIAPGMTNIILGRHYKEMEVKRFVCYVGGLPEERTLPYQYKAPFSPIDVIAEYTRDVSLIENGQIVEKPALSDIEEVEFKGIGTLEAFNTDGLRTLIKTMPVQDMAEKTMRYPGHAQIIKILRDTGFFSEESIEIQGTSLTPLELTAKLIFPKWKLGPEERELTAMKVIVQGIKDGKPKTYTYFMLDKFDPETKTSSMARSTGYTCNAAARLILENRFDKKGLIPPEYLGAEQECFESIMKYLANRNINFIITDN